MQRYLRLTGLLIVFMLIGILIPAGSSEHPALALRGKLGSAQGVVQAAPPQPLPHDCDGVTPPGEDPPPCCAYGYVYYDGVPVTGASVHIESPYGALDITTASGGASSQPYYGVDLSAAPLLVSPSDVITVTGTYEGSTASTVYEVAPDGQQVDVIFSFNPLFGDGRDGDLVVGDGQTVYTDNVRQSLSVTANAGQDALSVPNTAGFAIGDKVLIHQTKGSGVGLYELGTIENVGSESLTLYETLVNTYTVGGSSKAQVLRVPQYWNVTVENNGTLTAHSWNGNTGGILAFLANGMVTINGTVTTDGKGYRGGQGQNHTGGLGSRGEQGGNENGTQSNSGSANGMGGGGGETQGSDNCDQTVKSGGGGGGGGHATTGENGSPGACGGGSGGTGGGTFGTPNLETTITFGGAGGGGGGWRRCHIEKSDRLNGEEGGGIIMIWGSSFDASSGNISSRGLDVGGYSHHDEGRRIGHGGAGAGGSIYIAGITIDFSTSDLDIRGGTGNNSPWSCPGGKGGDGGVGRAQIQYLDDTLFKKPIVTIHTVFPHPAVQGQDVVIFRGSAVDNDEGGASIAQYVWRSDLDGLLSTQAEFTMPASELSAGTHTVYFKAKDDEGEWSEEVSTALTVNAEPTATPTATPPVSATSTNTPTPTPTVTPTNTPTPTPTPSLSPTWTFLLYLDGDNNLQPWLDRALNRLEENTNPHVNLLVLLDGAGSSDTWRYHVQPGGNYTDNVNRWYMGELDMSDPQTLTDFITWVGDNYPADHTYLAVADHGRGTTGIAWDHTSGGNQFITVAELRTALRNATADGAEPLDVVHYDACLMAMIEDVYQIKDYADYFIASENLGWSVFAYDRYVSGVTETTTPRDLAASIASEYHNHRRLADHPRTISILDLSQAGAVKDAVSTLATALEGSIADNKYYIRNTRDATQKFDSRDYLRITLEDEYLDLYHFAQLIKQNVPDNTVKDAAQGVMNAIGSGFVVAEHHESGTHNDNHWDLDDAHGISIYFPPASGGYGYSDYMSHVFRFTADSEWDEFLLAYYGAMGLPPMDEDDPGVAPMLEAGCTVYLPVVVKSQ